MPANSDPAPPDPSTDPNTDPVEEPESQLALTSDLAMYAARLVRLLRRELELTAASRVLSILDAEGPQGITALARLDGCSQPTMSSQVAQLAERGLVTKAPRPEDARGSVITLTDAGRGALAAVRSAASRTVHERLVATEHTTEELATAVALLRDLVEPRKGDCEARPQKGTE